MMAMTSVRWPWRRRALPASLRAVLDRDEHIQVVADCVDGKMLAASRLGLWVIDGESAERLGWESIAKARLTARVLSVIPTKVIGELADGTVVLVDEPTREYTLAGPSGLTDVVHSRVRRSLASRRYLEFPSGGGWVVLRRVPGRNGLTRQVRLDPAADARAPGFAAAVAALADDLQAVNRQ